MIRGWVIQSPDWVPLGTPVERSIEAPHFGAMRERLTFKIGITEPVKALVIMIDEPGYSAAYRLNTPASALPGDTLEVTVTRAVRP